MSDKIDYIQHLEIYCKEHNYDRPEYFHRDIQGGEIFGPYAVFRRMKYDPPIQRSYPSMHEAKNVLAKYILDTIEVANELCGPRQIVKKGPPIVLYSDLSDSIPFMDIFRYILEHGRDLEIIGFSKNSQTGKDIEKYINILNSHHVSSDPEYSLLWYVAENYGKLKERNVYINCANIDIKNYIEKRLGILE